MQTLILPGYSKENKEWVDEVAVSIKTGEVGVIRPFHWAHWTEETNKFEAKEKAELISRHIRGDTVNIIAKSLGTLVASYLCQIIPDQIEKIIFCGIPLKDLKLDEVEVIKNAINQRGDKFIGFQNVKDPHGTFDEVKDFGNIKMTNRDDHNYPFFEEFNKFLI